MLDTFVAGGLIVYAAFTGVGFMAWLSWCAEHFVETDTDEGAFKWLIASGIGLVLLLLWPVVIAAMPIAMLGDVGYRASRYVFTKGWKQLPEESRD